MHKTIKGVLILTALAGLVLAGCSSDDESDGASATTTEAAVATTAGGAVPTVAEFCADVEAASGDFQPGFDAIFEETPEPTMEDWVDFLPEPTQEFDDLIARLETVEPPPELAERFEANLEAMHTVSQNFHDSIAAGEAGDQARFDEIESRNQEVDLPAMDAALNDGPDPCAAEG